MWKISDWYKLTIDWILLRPKTQSYPQLSQEESSPAVSLSSCLNHSSVIPGDPVFCRKQREPLQEDHHITSLESPSAPLVIRNGVYDNDNERMKTALRSKSRSVRLGTSHLGGMACFLDYFTRGQVLLDHFGNQVCEMLTSPLTSSNRCELSRPTFFLVIWNAFTFSTRGV